MFFVFINDLINEITRKVDQRFKLFVHKLSFEDIMLSLKHLVFKTFFDVFFSLYSHLS